MFNQQIPRDDGYYWPLSICNIESLVSGMQFYINNPKEISRQGRNARKWALKYFNWSNNSNHLQTVFSSIHRIEKTPEILYKLIKYNHKTIKDGKEEIIRKITKKNIKKNKKIYSRINFW